MKRAAERRFAQDPERHGRLKSELAVGIGPAGVTAGQVLKLCWTPMRDTLKTGQRKRTQDNIRFSDWRQLEFPADRRVASRVL